MVEMEGGASLGTASVTSGLALATSSGTLGGLGGSTINSTFLGHVHIVLYSTIYEYVLIKCLHSIVLVLHVLVPKNYVLEAKKRHAGT